MVVKTIMSQNRQDTLFRNACFPQFLFDLLFLGTVYPAEQQPTGPARNSCTGRAMMKFRQ